MPKNKGKGGKNRRRGKNEGDGMKRELIRKDGDDQEYAQVQKMLGNGRLQAQCFDGKDRLCHIRGKMRKKIWINMGDIILIGLRSYQDNKADVILKYSYDEARILKSEGCLPENTELNENDDQQVEFADMDVMPQNSYNEARILKSEDSMSESSESDDDQQDKFDEPDSSTKLK